MTLKLRKWKYSSWMVRHFHSDRVIAFTKFQNKQNQAHSLQQWCSSLYTQVVVLKTIIDTSISQPTASFGAGSIN